MKTFIHTINVVSDNEPEQTRYLTDTICRNDKYRSIYNLNKPNKIYYYKTFEKECINIFNGLDNAMITRLDIAWDSEKDNYFDDTKKFYRYLLTAFSLAYKSKNSFIVKDMMTDEDKSFWVKCNYFDVTFYNKELQVIGKDIEEKTKARFEFRLKRLLKDDMLNLKEIIINHIENRIKKTLLYLEDVQEEYNKVLIEIYKNGCYKKISDLIIGYSDRIFTKKQLINLLQVIDDKKIKYDKKAQNIIDRYGVKCISENDMKQFINDHLRDMMIFFQDGSHK